MKKVRLKKWQVDIMREVAELALKSELSSDEFINVLENGYHAYKKEDDAEWWKSHNRFKWELRRNDILYNESVNRIHVVEYVGMGSVHFKSGSIVSLSGVKEFYTIVNFVEDRRDMEND